MKTKYYIPSRCRDDKRFIVNMAKGQFFELQPDQIHYRPIEAYISAASHKTPEQHAERLCERLLNGELTIRRGLTNSGYVSTTKFKWDGEQLTGVFKVPVKGQH